MGANTDKSPKKLVGVTVAIVALLVSASAVYLDYKHSKDASEELKKQIEIDEAQNRQSKELVETQIQQNRHLEELAETQIQQYEELREQNRQLEKLVETHKQHYDELKKEFDNVIKPHTRHEEIYDYISLLYDRLMLYRDWVSKQPTSDKRAIVEPYYRKALGNFQRAEEELRSGNFTGALQLIDDAYYYMIEGSKKIASSNTTAAK